MKTIWTPVIVLIILVICFEVYVNTSSSELPEKVASHFGLKGEADDWMSRSDWISLMSVNGVALPGLFVAIAILLPFTPARFVNIRDRDYWLAPERRRETFACISDTVLWAACLMVLLFAGIQYLTIEANKVSPERLPMVPLVVGLACFLAANVALVIRLMRRFVKRQ